MIFLHNTEGITLTRHAGASVTPKSAKKYVRLVLWPVSLSEIQRDNASTKMWDFCKYFMKM